VFELGARDLELRLGSAPWPGLKIRILDPDGQPVPRCRLWVMTGSAGGKTGTQRTVDGGTIVLRTLPSGPLTDLVIGNATDAEGRPLDVVGTVLKDVDTSRKEIVIRLEAGRTLNGRVVDPDGRPVPGVRVFPSSRGLPGMLGGVAFVRTDAQGRFELTGMPLKPLRLTARSTGPWRSSTLDVDARQERVLIEVRRGATFDVEVVGPRGQPVEGAKVTVRTEDPRSAWRRRGPTDSAGHFRVPGVPAGARLVIDVDTRGLERALPSTRRGPVPLESGRIRIQLAAPNWIEGVVLDPDGKAVGVARVRADGKHAPTAFGVTLHTTSDAKTGRFRLGPLEVGTYWLSASGGRNRELVGTGQVLVTSPTTNARLMLPRRASVAGRLHVPEVKGWSLLWLTPAQNWAANLVRGGYFEIPGVADLDGTLWARGPGGRYALIEHVRPGDGPFDLRPLTGGRIEGRIDGPDASDGSYTVSATHEMLCIWGQIQEDGTFVFEGVPPGAWRVVVRDLDKEVTAVENVEPDGTPLVLTLPTSSGETR